MRLRDGNISAFIVLSALLLGSFFYSPFYLAPPLSPDSWSYFELSKTVFSDFYHFSTFRSYENSSSYSASFPPLWPFFLACFNVIFDQGPRAGVILNIILLPVIALSLERLAYDIFRLKYLGLISFLICLSDVSFIDEVLAGRAVPLQILILILLFRVLSGIKKDSGKGSFVRSGILLGFCLLNRFDAVAIVPVIVIFVAILRPGMKKALIFLSSFFITILPWIVYSRLHFGSFWKTDNSFVAKAVARSYVTDWYPLPILTLREDFGGWLERVLGNIHPLFYAYFQGLWELGFAFGVVILSILVFSVWQFLVSKRDKDRELGIEKEKYPLVFKFFCLLMFFNLFAFLPNLVTAYFDLRYFAFQRMLLVMFVLGVVVLWARLLFGIGPLLVGLGSPHPPVIMRASSGLEDPTSNKIATTSAGSRNDNWNKCFPSLYVILLVPLLLALAYHQLPERTEASEVDPLKPAWINEIGACLQSQEDFSGAFFLDSYNPFQFGALAGLKTGSVPENFKILTASERRLFFKSFGFSHVLSSKTLEEITRDLGVRASSLECSKAVFRITVP